MELGRRRGGRFRRKSAGGDAEENEDAGVNPAGPGPIPWPEREKEMRRSWRWPSIYLAFTRTTTACSTTAAERVKLGEEEMVAPIRKIREERGGEGEGEQVRSSMQLLVLPGPRHGADDGMARAAWALALWRQCGEEKRPSRKPPWH